MLAEASSGEPGAVFAHSSTELPVGTHVQIEMKDEPKVAETLAVRGTSLSVLYKESAVDPLVHAMKADRVL